MLINIVSWILFGAISGWIAALIVGDKDDQGIAPSVVVGIVGALIGGFFVHSLLIGAESLAGFDLSSLMVAIVGAVVLIAFLRGFGKA